MWCDQSINNKELLSKKNISSNTNKKFKSMEATKQTTEKKVWFALIYIQPISDNTKA